MQMNIPNEMVNRRFKYLGPVYDGTHCILLEAVMIGSDLWYFEERWPNERARDCCLTHDEFIDKLNSMKIPHALSGDRV